MATTTSTTRASFSIYRDEPSPPQPKRHASPTTSNPPTSPITNRVAPILHEKENVNPLTGHLPTIGQKLAKKRKTGAVLTAKIVLSTKSLKEAQPETKKRRLVAKTKTRGEKEKKEKRVLVSKKERLERVRKATDLPRVEEEQSEEVEEKEKVTQALVDARCYELTVMPLADVSEAYSPTTVRGEEGKDEKDKALKSSSKVRVSVAIFSDIFNLQFISLPLRSLPVFRNFLPKVPTSMNPLLQLFL